MRTAPVLHVVFDPAASGCLKQVLAKPRVDGIAWLFDDLSLGPIDRTEGAARTRWLQEQFGEDAFEEAAAIDGFWAEVASTDRCVVAYVSRRNAREYAGLLEVLRRRGEGPLEIVDVTDVEESLGLAELSPERVIERKLLESAAPLSATAALGHAQTWARLRQENAPLRIVEHGTLVSAPITHFDARLLSFAPPEWQPAARMLDAFYSTARAEGVAPPDVRFILSRLAALVASGQLAGQGDLATFDGSRAGLVKQSR